MAKEQIFGHWIDNAYVSASDNGLMNSINPLDDSLFAQVAAGTKEDVDNAVKSADERFQTFSNTSTNDREAWLCKAAQLLEERFGQFIDILIDEGGSSRKKAEFETGKAISFLRGAVGIVRQMSGKTLPSDYPDRFSMTWRYPRGVVAVITPFNVPLIKATRLCANALATGSTVVLMPSSEHPVLSLKFAELMADAGFPAGALNVITGNGYDIGDSLTCHPAVRTVTFTGSTVIGKHIQLLCAERNKHVTLELGGKSPLVIMDDANLQEAVEGAIRGIFMHQGQACVGSSRIYVQKGVYPKFVEKFTAIAGKLSMGDLRDPDTIIGPIISPKQRGRVKDHIEDARAKGATVATGGTWHNNRCAPTVLLNVSEEMDVCKEETFGPVVSVYQFDDFEEAMKQANDSVYGLSSAIFTGNLKNALEYARQIQSGMVHINGPSISDEAHVPFGGRGDSGFGREGTEADLETYTELKWVTVRA